MLYDGIEYSGKKRNCEDSQADRCQSWPVGRTLPQRGKGCVFYTGR